jgi:hypothetical protein
LFKTNSGDVFTTLAFIQTPMLFEIIAVYERDSKRERERESWLICFSRVSRTIGQERCEHYRQTQHMVCHVAIDYLLSDVSDTGNWREQERDSLEHKPLEEIWLAPWQQHVVISNNYSTMVCTQHTASTTALHTLTPSQLLFTTLE